MVFSPLGNSLLRYNLPTKRLAKSQKILSRTSKTSSNSDWKTTRTLMISASKNDPHVHVRGDAEPFRGLSSLNFSFKSLVIILINDYHVIPKKTSVCMCTFFHSSDFFKDSKPQPQKSCHLKISLKIIIIIPHYYHIDTYTNQIF